MIFEEDEVGLRLKYLLSYIVSGIRGRKEYYIL